MGYLSQKKRQKNIKELLIFSLVLLLICCFFLLFFKESSIASFLSKGLFHIYLYMICISVVALFFHFYWQGIVLIFGSFLLFLIIGMGSNLFMDVKTPGLQKIRIFYQPDISQLYETEKQLFKARIDVAGVTRHNLYDNVSIFPGLNVSLNKKDKNLILTPHKIMRSGDVLLSKNNKASFAEIKVNLLKFVFISLDFSKSSFAEVKTALKNLSEFVNMQDTPVIIVGKFGIEAWAPDFLNFMDKTGLEVKNSIILNDGKHFFNPFIIPTINILAYKDFGISRIEFLPVKKNKIHPLLIELNY